MGAFLCDINYNLIINLVTYIVFALIILSEVFKGFKRGLIPASVRLGIFAVLMVIALFISTPIAKGLLGIDVSFLNVKVNGEVQTTIPAVIKGLLYQSDAIKNAAEASPALTAIIEGLPVAILSLVVFFILIWLFKWISFGIFKILDRWALPSSKLHREYKKQLKIQKKASKKGEKVLTVTLPVPPNRHKWAGAVVGLVMGLVVAFCVYLPFGATFGLVEDIAGSSEMTAEAEDGKIESLDQTSGDLVRYYLPKEAMESVDTYNSSFISKFVSFGGLDNVIYDYLTQIKADEKNIHIREEVLNVAKGYDSVVELLNQRNNSPDGWKGLSIKRVEESIKVILKSDLLDALVPELAPYILDNYVYDSEFFTNLTSSETLKLDIQNLIQYYQDNGFMDSLIADIDPIFDVFESAFDTDIINELTTKNFNVDKIIESLEQNDNNLLNSLVNLVFESKLVKVAGSFGINFAEKIVNKNLELDPALMYVNSDFFKDDEKQAITDVILSAFDAYNSVKEIDFDNFDITAISDEEIKAVASILTAVQNDVFKKYENGVLVLRSNAEVDKVNKTVTNGGMLSNAYITLVDYILADYIDNISYQNASWEEVLLAVKNIATIENIEDLNFEDVMNLLSLSEDLGESAKKIAEAVSDLDVENLTTEDVTNVLSVISESLEDIDEDTFNNIIDKISDKLDVPELKDKADYTMVTDSIALADELVNLYTDENITADEISDSVLENLTKSEIVLKEVAEAGVTLSVDDSEKAEISTKIENATENAQLQNYLKTIFGIN